MTPLQTKRRVILIVDDNMTNLKVAVDYLKAYGFEIVVARNGESGIERAKFAQPDLILLDVQMPGLDGFETCRRLKANPETAAIPVIFMTALSDTVERVKGLEVGAVDYIVKPIEEAEVLARVNTHLTLRDLQLQLQKHNEELEERVRERTAALEAEMTQRKKHQEDKENLFQLVHQQSEQIRSMTGVFLEGQQQQSDGVQNLLSEQVERELSVLEQKLKQAQTALTERGHLSQARQQVGDYLQTAESLIAQIRQQTQQASSNLSQGTADRQSLLANPLFNLSTREYEVLQLLVEGKSNNDIAEILVLSKSTVSTYRKRIMEKLDIHDLPSLVKFAMQHNLTA